MCKDGHGMPRLWHNLSEASLIRAKTTVLEADFDRRGMRWGDVLSHGSAMAVCQAGEDRERWGRCSSCEHHQKGQFHPVPSSSMLTYSWLTADFRLTCMTQPNAPFGSLEQWSTGKSWCWVQHATGRKPMSQHFRQMITDFRAKDGETWWKTLWWKNQTRPEQRHWPASRTPWSVLLGANSPNSSWILVFFLGEFSGSEI